MMIDRDEEIDKLKKQVSFLRWYIVNKATQQSPHPSRARELLINSALELKTREGLWHWERKTLHGVVDIAKVDDSNCAYCPLCGAGVAEWGGPERRGFRYPIGLENHLQGTHRASQCFIMSSTLFTNNILI